MRKFKQRPGGRATCACMCPASEWCPARTLPRQGRRRGCAVGVDRMRRCPMSWWSPRGPRPSRPAITRGGPLGVEALGRHGALSWSRTGPVQASWATTTRMPGRSHLRRNGPDPQHHQLQAVAPSGEATMEHARVLEPSLTGGGHLPGDEMDRPDSASRARSWRRRGAITMEAPRGGNRRLTFLTEGDGVRGLTRAIDGPPLARPCSGAPPVPAWSASWPPGHPAGHDQQRGSQCPLPVPGGAGAPSRPPARHRDRPPLPGELR